MRRLILFAVIVLVTGFAMSKFELDELKNLKLVPKNSTSEESGEVPVQHRGDVVKIASFHINVLTPGKLQKSHVTDHLARIIRQFDVVAIQGIRSRDDGTLPRLIEFVNATGAKYDYVIGPRLPRQTKEESPGETHQEQFAFVFDRASLEVDRLQLYTVDDPEDVMIREPLVAWFRVRGVEEENAFTFSLVNIHLDEANRAQELAILPNVFTAVQGDGRDEDDVILLGNFQTSERDFQKLKSIPQVDWVVTATPTDVMATEQRSNIVFSGLATSEYQGRGGVIDFLRDHNLSEYQAREVSEEMPVWAEFSIYEGGKPGQVAAGERSRY